MVLQIDIPTILFSLTVINFSAVIIILFQSKFSRNSIDISYFSGNKLLQGFVWLLLFFHYHQPSESFKLLADMLFILGIAFESILFVRFKERFEGRVKKVWWW